MNKYKLPPIFKFGIRQKILLVLITVLLIALTVSGWFALEKEKKDVLQEIHQRGTDISRFVSKSLAFSVVGYDYHTIQLLLDEITSSEDIGYAKVSSTKGNTMGESGKMNTPFGDMVIFNEDIKFDSQAVGQLTLGLTTTKTIQRLEAQKYTLVEREGLIILLIAIGEFLALSYVIIRPVSIMSKSLDNSIDENGKIIGMIPITSQDEFGQLASQFNQLSTQLNEANYRLQSKVELADEQLRKTNQQLMQQSEELKRINEEFKQMSVTDSLTGLYNRRQFEDLMSTEIALSLRHGDTNSILVVDIDHFKGINDTYGHFAGDMVLKETANILKRNMRKTDVLCRVGGEEFVVLCKRADKQNAMEIGEKLRATVAQRKFNLSGQAVQITVSVGVATIPDNNNTDTTEAFYRCADVALYYSKEKGRDRVSHYDDTLPDRKRSNLTVASVTEIQK